jgi:hypothetical protein
MLKRSYGLSFLMEVEEGDEVINGAQRKNFFFTFNFNARTVGLDRALAIQQFGPDPDWGDFPEVQASADIAFAALTLRLDAMYWIWCYEVFLVVF